MPNLLRAFSCFAFLLFFLPAAHATHHPNTDHDLLLHDIALRPGVSVDINVRVFVDEGRPYCGRTVVALHGFAHTAATWEPFAEALFDRRHRRPVCRVAAIDLPGRGGSSLPGGIAYGDLTLDDHVTALLATLDGLRQHGIRARSLVAHSQGGLLVQMAQQRLLDQGTDLRRAHRVRNVVLLAPVAPDGIPWSFSTSGAAGTLIGQFLTTDPTLGSIIAFPDVVFPGLFFTDLVGTPAAGTPSPGDVGAFGYNAPEPLFATLGLVGSPPFARANVSPGAFDPSRRTRLSVATFEQDILIRPEENAMLYEHLTGDHTLHRLVVIGGPGTVHDLYIADPAGLLTAAGRTLRF